MGTIEREPEVIDNLTSTSTIDALSANQGKTLNDKINNAITPTYYTPSRGTKVSSAETTIYKVGNIVTGFIIASISATMSTSSEVIVTGLPGARNVVQLPLICVAGTNAGKTGRCRIETNGSILTWFTPFAPASGEVYLIPVNYVTS